MIDCPICKNESVLIWKEKKNRVYRCKNCTLAFLYPAPENPEEIYGEKYFKNWYLKHYGGRKKYFEGLWKKIENLIPGKGRLFDIGCGVGIFMDVAKEKGWNVCGQDVSSFAVDYCRKKGYVIYDKSLLKINLPENSLDVITMLDVLAHLKNPVEYIEKAKKILKPGGLLIIKTPYHPGFLFLIANLLSLTGRSKSLLHIPAQLYHFDTQSLRNIIKSEGLFLLYSEKTQDFLKIDVKNPKILLSNLLKLSRIEGSILTIAISYK